MTKRDFEEIAKALGTALKDGVSVNQANDIVGKFASNIAHTNPKFNYQRFVTRF